MQGQRRGKFEIVELSRLQRSVLVGTLLGDGCLALHGRNPRLHVKHKGSHRALVDFKRQVFEDYTSMAVHEFDQRLGGKLFPCAQFATRTSTAFLEWYHLFYRDGRKVVPREIDQLLSPLGLAVWFMDDGAADHAGVTFQTHSFSLDEVQLLSRAMDDLFHLATRIRKNRDRWIIYVPAASMDRLQSLVRPWLLAEFAYKFARRSRNPVETKRWPPTARLG